MTCSPSALLAGTARGDRRRRCNTPLSGCDRTGPLEKELKYPTGSADPCSPSATFSQNKLLGVSPSNYAPLSAADAVLSSVIPTNGPREFSRPSTITSKRRRGAAELTLI